MQPEYIRRSGRCLEIDTESILHFVKSCMLFDILRTPNLVGDSPANLALTCAIKG